jgi:hypothetical protein
VLDPIDYSYGKYPTALGNVAQLDASMVQEYIRTLSPVISRETRAVINAILTLVGPIPNANRGNSTVNTTLTQLPEEFLPDFDLKVRFSVLFLAFF